MFDFRDFTQAAVRLDWTRRLLAPIDEAAWEEMARELFAWQFARVAAYRRLCLAHDVTPQNLDSWRQIPAVPQQLFKRTILYAHGSTSPSAIYVTSGTTTGQPGRQHLLDIDIYRAVSVEGARRAGLLADGIDLHFITPPRSETPYSSLSAMFTFWQKSLPGQKGEHFWVRGGQFQFDRLRDALYAQIEARRPVGLCGTAFSFVHLLDTWAGLPPLRLPRGSRLLETGGFKGRSREISKAELYAGLSKTFAVRDEAIWNEYGMSELSSQAYARGTNGIHHTPPWARAIVCHPATGREVAVGQRGLVRWIDLANTDSVLALQTLDLAERTRDGFRLIGRMARTEPRGCSLSAEDMAAQGAFAVQRP